MAEPHTPGADALRDITEALRWGFRALFTIWQALLTRVVRWTAGVVALLGTLARRTARKSALVSAYVTQPTEAWSDTDDTVRSAAAAFGVTSLIAGLMMSGALAANTGESAVGIALIVLTEILWATVRYVILALLSPVRSVSRAKLVTAYLAGLIPYAIGLTPALRVVSLAWSAILTERGLRGAGVPDRVRRTGVSWSFGGQAVAMLAGVLGRGALVVLLGLG